jgi:hypothetical protein
MAILAMSLPLLSLLWRRRNGRNRKHGQDARATHGQDAHATIYFLAFVSYFDMSYLLANN